MPPFSMIAERIKYFRSLRRKTQAGLAKLASIDYRHYQKLEAGQSDFKASTIFKLSEALSIPACYLLSQDPFDGRQSQICSSNIITRLNIGLVAWNVNGKVVFCNKRLAELLDVSSEEDVINSVEPRKLVPYEEYSLKHAQYLKDINTGKICSDFVRLRINLPNTESEKLFMALWTRVTGKDGECCGYAAAVWDDMNCKDISVLPRTKKSD